MKAHPVTVTVRYDLYRRLRRIAQNEGITIEAVAEDMLTYQLETVGHGRARAHTEPLRPEKIYLADDDEPDGEREACG